MYRELRKTSITITLLTITITLFGLLMVYDSSNIWASYKYADEFYFIKRQILFAIIGFFLFFIGTRIKLIVLQKYSKHLLIFSLVLLLLVIIPGIGQVRNGSRSWFGIGSIGFQPSELFKITLIIYASDFLSRKYSKSARLKDVLPLLLIALLGFVLIMLEPDFGSGLVTLCALAMLLFVSKLKARYYIIMGSLALIFLVVLILIAPYRFERITSFVDPYSDPLGSGFQIIQSLYAIGPGGLVGFGFLNSLQKHYYLPEPQTDFIFSIVVSNYGLVGALLLLGAYGYLFYSSYHISKLSDDPFTSFLKIGLTNIIVIQSSINLMVVSGLLPVTGITLPLLSYGGSSLLVTLFSLSLIASSKGEKDEMLSLLK